MSLIAGNPPHADTAEQAVANAGAHLKGRIFAAGASLALSLAFLVGGFSLALGQDELVAVTLAMGSFLVVTIISFVGELLVEPSLERVAQEREVRRIEEERESIPSAGGLLASRQGLTGGTSAVHPGLAHGRPPEGVAGVAGVAGVVGGPKGRRLDVTLPEERSSTASATTGAVGGRTSPATPSAASDDGFQDLASLLQEAAQPSPVPVRQRQ